jgi:adenosylhomocysteine nucleosidase
LSELGIVSALAADARHLCRDRPRPGVITRIGAGALLIVTGMGCSAAAAGARALIEAGAGALLSFGLAGALDPALAPGTVCLPSTVISHEGASVSTTQAWREELCEALAARCLVTGGKLLTAPAAIESVAEKAKAFRDTGATLVDMESFSVGQVAVRHGLPFMAVRVIVDAAGDALPPCVTRAVEPSGEVPIGRLLGGLAARPQELPAVIRLGSRYRAASRALAAVADSGSLAPPAAAET